jgi:precorrin-6A/cobalt-precorrin-6A reductase
VCKNSGGALGTEKLQAARLLGLPVVMIARPAKPPALSAAGPEALAEAAEGLLSP